MRGSGHRGRPSLHAEKKVQQGRVYELSSERQWGTDAATGEVGMVGKVVDHTFRAGEGRALVRDAGKPLGWSEGMGREQKKIGLAAALFSLAPVVVIGVVAGIILLVS